MRRLGNIRVVPPAWTETRRKSGVMELSFSSDGQDAVVTHASRSKVYAISSTVCVKARRSVSVIWSVEEMLNGKQEEHVKVAQLDTRPIAPPGWTGEAVAMANCIIKSFFP